MRKIGQIRMALAALVWLLCVQNTPRALAEAMSRVEIGQIAPDFTALGADGEVHHLVDYAGKIVVLEWMSPVCPYTTLKYRSGAMQALQRQAHRMGAVWLSIDTAASDRPGYLSSKAFSARIARTHALVTAALSDTNGAAGRAYGARTTPSFFIIGRDGRLVYQGAMDDGPEVDDNRGKNYIRDALNHLAKGAAVHTPETRTYGCAVEY